MNLSIDYLPHPNYPEDGDARFVRRAKGTNPGKQGLLIFDWMIRNKLTPKILNCLAMCVYAKRPQIV